MQVLDVKVYNDYAIVEVGSGLKGKGTHSRGEGD